jgi:hypothetical protein
MTPELNSACELVFQEHKSSPYPVTWNRDAFRGRLSTGLTEMAKDTLIRKKIIQYAHPPKKILTVLNETVTHANNFEEAERMVGNPVTAMNLTGYTHEVTSAAPAKHRTGIYVARKVSHPPVVRLAAPSGSHVSHQAIPVSPYIPGETIRWYLKPVFVYGVWPICAAIAGGVIAYLMGSAYIELVFDLKN